MKISLTNLLIKINPRLILERQLLKGDEMKKIFIVIVFLGIIYSNARAEEKHLFILSGQSNMAGLNPEISFIPTVEKEFGKENITVVKHAISGRPIRLWDKKYKFPGNKKASEKDKKGFGSIYVNLMKKVKNATQGKSYDTVTFVWMQGERDAKERLSEVYAESFMRIIDQLKTDLKKDNINFVIGRISDFDMSDKRYKDWTKIRDIQVKLAEDNPNGEWVDTDDLNDKTNAKTKKVKNDLHYTKTGYKTLGKRFADKAIELVKKK